MEKLQKITDSMAKVARKSGIEIVTGDTKVISKKEFSGIIINTSGVGIVVNPTSINNVKCGDVLIVSGSLGDHSTAILTMREG